MQQESKVIAFRQGEGDRLLKSLEPAAPPSFLPAAFAEDLRWVLRQLQSPRSVGPERPKRDPAVSRWLAIPLGSVVLIAIGAFVWTHRDDGSSWQRYLPLPGGTAPPTSQLALPGPERPAVPKPLALSATGDVAAVQRRLADLGFFSGTPTGIWGPRSRQALRDFKVANGLMSADEDWNASIQAKLFDPNAQPKRGQRAGVETVETTQAVRGAVALLATLDPARPADAARMQSRLADLGFFVANIDGAWGPASRAALRDFKIANSLSPDERWDARTEAALENQRAKRAPEPFIGTWASDLAECRLGPGAGIRIGRSRAEGYGASCSFGPVRREGPGWHVAAVCRANGATWDANIGFSVSGDRLEWSSERGTSLYVRCKGS